MKRMMLTLGMIMLLLGSSKLLAKDTNTQVVAFLAQVDRQERLVGVEDAEIIYEDKDLIFYDNGVVIYEEASFRLNLTDAFKLVSLLGE